MRWALALALVLATPTTQTVPAADHEVSFTVDGTTTYGTLHIPAHPPRRTLKAALLLPGSGPTDRNGDQPTLTPHTLTKLAEALARDGVASLRFDKYGTGRTAYTGNLDYPAFVRQADAAYRFLAARPEVDRRAIRLIGHSEGALTALQVAVTAHPHPAGVGLLQPLAQRFLDVLGRQLRAQLPPESHTAVDQAIADLRADRPVTTDGMLPAVAQLFQSLAGPNRRYVRSIDALDPAAVARQLPPHTRTLVTCGSVDPQVPCETTTALPGLRVVLPGVGHLMTDPANPEALAPALLDALHRFLGR